MVGNKKQVKRMLVLITSIAIGSLLVLTGLLLIWSPGKPGSFLDENGKQLAGSISEKIFIPVGGVRQGMFIRSKNVDNPVLLYVHGGPSFPNYFLIDKYDPGLEDYFTVCYWEQRGGGLSYVPEVTLQSMNFNQLASDAVEVTNYLRKRFEKEKIFMIAHSGGTPISLLAASRNPQLYHAYIAMAQITDQKESEKMAYAYMLDQYTRDGNQKRIKELEAYKVPESDSNVIAFFKSSLRDQSMHELGIGTMHEMRSVFRDVFIPVWTCRAYTIREKVNIWKSKFSFLPKTTLVEEMLQTNFSREVQELEIPVYFFSGQYDLTVNIELSKAYLKELRAPLKGFYTFENSAHSPLFEEPLRVRQIIEQDVLQGKNSLADKE
ncbi:MAG: alpha/beta hydrolase [Lewinellaceae bacterium]|nr:alpha/beta hydrolase [Lewinellaceae bacterium]